MSACGESRSSEACVFISFRSAKGLSLCTDDWVKLQQQSGERMGLFNKGRLPAFERTWGQVSPVCN